MSMLLNTSKELNQIIDDLKEDAAKIGGIQFKKLTVLIEETLQNLKDDNDEIMDKYKELESLPETKSE